MTDRTDAAGPVATANHAKATVAGLGAVLLWGMLASLTALAGPIPPFQFAAMTFAIGTLVGLGYGHLTQTKFDPRAIPFGAWALGVYGLLGFHVAYFYALQSAPLMEVSLLVYLWPLLLVLFSSFLPASLGGCRLAVTQIAGALLGFGGVVLLITGNAVASDLASAWNGLAAAVLAAVIWSSYSVGSRLYRGVPSTAVTGFCAATCIGALGLHLTLERTLWPQSATAWLAVIGCGLGPVGLAFYIWDDAMKRGDIRLLGVASYATPLISTLMLALLGLGAPSGRIWLAALLITAGAMLASRVTLPAKPDEETT